jgi:exopolysaccharide production protein ExoQ
MTVFPPTLVPATDSTARQRVVTLDYFICFVSFLSLLLNNLYGMLAIIGFLLPWAWVVMRQWHLAVKDLLANAGLLLFAVFAAVSTLWSDDPSWTLKASAELFATMAIGILAGCRVKPRVLIAALLSTYVVIAVLCIAHDGQTLLWATGDTPLLGIFGSKNAFSAMMSVQLLVALGVISDRGQTALFRSIAILTLIFAPVLLYFGHSLGAVLAVIMTVSIFLSAQSLKYIHSGLRILAYFFLVIFLVLAFLLPFLTEMEPGKLLNLLGKDSTLTGRTYLWSHAMQYIAERPLLGTGFSAFWRVQNPNAQELWYMSAVPPGSGFNFHNEYLEMFVGLGAGGFLYFVSCLFIAGKNAFRSIFEPGPPERKFAFIMYIFFLIRSPVEVGIFGQFNIGMILFCVIWIYLKPLPSEKRLPVPPPNFYVPPSTKVLPS